jgi:hypothetical protein
MTPPRYEIRVALPTGTIAEQGFDSPADMGREFAAITREAAVAFDTREGEVTFQTHAVARDGSVRPLSVVEEAAFRAGMDQVPGFNYREEES